jgi:hypothetical protein
MCSARPRREVRIHEPHPHKAVRACGDQRTPISTQHHHLCRNTHRRVESPRGWHEEILVFTVLKSQAHASHL